MVTRPASREPVAPSAFMRGFTLVELLVVLTIMALLVSLVTPRYVDRMERARENVLASDLATMRDAIDKYWSDSTFELTIHVGCVTGRRG